MGAHARVAMIFSLQEKIWEIKLLFGQRGVPVGLGLCSHALSNHPRAKERRGWWLKQISGRTRPLG